MSSKARYGTRNGMVHTASLQCFSPTPTVSERDFQKMLKYELNLYIVLKFRLPVPTPRRVEASAILGGKVE